MYADMILLTCVLSLGGSSEQPDLARSSVELFEIINDVGASLEKRTAAENQLLAGEYDNALLPHVFKALGDPVGEWQDPKNLAAVSMFPGTGSIEGDRILPPEAQIVYARLRVWKAFARSAQPEEERMALYEQFFEEATTEFQMRHLIYESSRNWSPTVRQHLLTIYKDQTQRPHTRRSAANRLLQTQSTPRQESRAIAREIIKTAWEERGTELARLIGERLGSRTDPRVALLRLDVYEHWRATTTQAPLTRGMQRYPDHFESQFGNVSGLYRDPRERRSLSEDELKRRDRRLALLQEARETGDDTKLRAFEAEIEAQRQAELAHRIKKIDEWIAANRERLEAEAAAYTPPEIPQR